MTPRMKMMMMIPMNNSLSHTNTENVEDNQETSVHSRHQRHAVWLPWSKNARASCSPTSTQSGDADAVPKLMVENNTNFGTSTLLIKI
jgi:hypothetical protein